MHWRERRSGVRAGAVLPDLASMVHVRIDRSLLGGPVGDGMRCHIDADAIFHDHPDFRAGSGGAASRPGQPRPRPGPGTPSGIGMELRSTAPSSDPSRYALLAGAIGQPLSAIAEPDRGRWLGFELLASAPATALRRSPWVAERLHDLLARRLRLRFSPARSSRGRQRARCPRRWGGRSRPGVLTAVTDGHRRR